MTPEMQFRQWESRVFGAGYGSGELPILKAVKTFFGVLEAGRNYDYRTLEKALGDTVAWLLINAFNKANVIEWGSSARFGWLTPCGEFVRSFVADKSAEELYEMVMRDEEPICECDGELASHAGHADCDKNPMVHEKYASQLKFG